MDSQAFFDGLFQCGKPFVFERNELVTAQGAKEKYVYKISQGAILAFIDFDGQQNCLRLGYQNSIITSINSFLTGQASPIYLLAIRKTTGIKVSADAYKAYINQSPAHQNAYQTVLEHLLIEQTARELDLLTSSPAERLERLTQRSPQVFSHIPLKYIASYLRMSAETLSRLRNIDLGQDK